MRKILNDAADVIESLGLRPLEGEGGYFLETWRGPQLYVPPEFVPLGGKHRLLATAIYYLITPTSFSTLHRLRADEIFHFYLGDPCQMLLMGSDGKISMRLLGTDLAAGMRPQVVVPGGIWQGTKLCGSGRFALLGTTMAPGFHPDDFELGRRDNLFETYPEHTELIEPFLSD